MYMYLSIRMIFLCVSVSLSQPASIVHVWPAMHRIKHSCLTSYASHQVFTSDQLCVALSVHIRPAMHRIKRLHPTSLRRIERSRLTGDAWSFRVWPALNRGANQVTLAVSLGWTKDHFFFGYHYSINSIMPSGGLSLVLSLALTSHELHERWFLSVITEINRCKM